MSLHKKIIVLAALGMLLVTIIAVVSLSRVMNVFSSISGEMERSAGETRSANNIAQAVNAMSTDLHRYTTVKDPAARKRYLDSQDTVNRILNELEHTDSGGKIAAVLRTDANRLAERSARVFELRDPVGRDRNSAYILVVECDSLIEWMRRDLQKQFNEAQTLQSGRIADHVLFQKQRIILLFLMVLISSLGFLIAFSVYINRKLTLPLNALWQGAQEISHGNLEYRIKLRGRDDMAQLARRFNDMALQIQSSYAELETKLFERTKSLATIDSVALTLSQAMSIGDMMKRSLARIIENMEHLEPRGGVFLCDPEGETLRLIAHDGLSPQFVRREQTIRMGECLCGIAAQTGEILHVGYGCSDERHTRTQDAGAHAHICIPIKSRGIVLGVVFLYPQKPFSLKPSDFQMLDMFGSQIGMAVENLRLYAEVKESSEKFWDLFENSRDILFTMDASGTLTAVNREAELLTGHSKSELIGKSIFEFLLPASAETVRQALAGDIVPGNRPVEYEIRRRNGETACLEVSARRMPTRHALAGYQISARDITEQKLLREKLVQAERLGAIGEVVITVRHEINNPLTTVIGNTELLLERFADKDPALTVRLETILNNSLRIAEIVKQLQTIRRDKVVEYVDGISMTDLKQE